MAGQAAVHTLAEHAVSAGVRATGQGDGEPGACAWAVAGCGEGAAVSGDEGAGDGFFGARDQRDVIGEPPQPGGLAAQYIPRFLGGGAYPVGQAFQVGIESGERGAQLMAASTSLRRRVASALCRRQP